MAQTKPSKVLLTIRGAPGAGKTTIAEALVRSGLFDVYHEADKYFETVDGYHWVPDDIGKAHRWCMGEVQRDINRGLNIIVSNTFTKEWEVEPYHVLALRHGYTYQEMILPLTPFSNVHGVPLKKVEQMQEKLLASMREEYK